MRKHLSRIKGGRLARARLSGRVVTLAISDVPGDDPAVIGSGPTVPDPTTLADARAVVARYQLDLPAGGDARARRSGERNAEARRCGLRRHELSARSRGPPTRSRAAEAARSAAGYECVLLGDQLEGEARDGRGRARAAGARAAGRRAAAPSILSGGELTVTMRGKGRGGPNQEYALALAIALAGAHGHRGARRRYRRHRWRRRPRRRPRRRLRRCAPRWRARAALGLDPAAFLADNNSTGFFSGLGDLLTPGPTFTNVNDFRAIVVDRP